MKPWILGAAFSMVLLAAARPVLGQDPAPASKPAGPKIRFSEMAFDFGKIRSMDLPRHDFIVTNVGDAELEITSVVPGCGCTTAAEWDHKIPPGKTGRIPIQFNPGQFNGLVTNKYISVSCNDPAKGNYTLYLHANVWRPLEVQPAQHVYFMPIEGEATNESKTIRIVSNVPESVTLEAPESANPALKAEVKTLQPGKEFEVRITFDQKVSTGVTNGLITIKTSTTNMPVVNVTIYAMVMPALIASPSQIRLPVASTPVGYRQTAVIMNRGSTPVKLSDVAINAEGVNVEMAETQPGKLFTVNIDIPPKFEVRDGLELTAKTTHPKYPVFHLPLLPPAPQLPALTKPPVRASNPNPK